MCLEFPMNPHLLNNKEANSNVVNILTGGGGSGNKFNILKEENSKKPATYEATQNFKEIPKRDIAERDPANWGMNLASGKNLENQKDQNLAGKVARKPFTGLENTLAAPGGKKKPADDGAGGDARRDFFFDHFIKRVNMPSLKKELKIEADEEEEDIIMRQKENRRIKNLQQQRGQNVTKKNTIREKQALLKKNFHDHSKLSAKKNNQKKSPILGKNKQPVNKQSRRILKPAYGQQMVLIRREKNSDHDKSQAILNFKNTAGNNALMKARQDFEDSETNFLGLSDEEKEVGKEGKKNRVWSGL